MPAEFCVFNGELVHLLANTKQRGGMKLSADDDALPPFATHTLPRNGSSGLIARVKRLTI